MTSALEHIRCRDRKHVSESMLGEVSPDRGVALSRQATGFTDHRNLRHKTSALRIHSHKHHTRSDITARMAVHILDDYYLAITLLITIAYQLFFFAWAWAFKFDKVRLLVALALYQTNARSSSRMLSMYSLSVCSANEAEAISPGARTLSSWRF